MMNLETSNLEKAADKEIPVEKKVVVYASEIQDEAQRLQRQRIDKIGAQFSFYGLLSLVFGVCYSVCLYKNPSGITVPVFISVYYVLALLILKKMGIEIKKESYGIIAVSVLIGISTCRTASGFLISYNKTALFLLSIVFWLHQSYQDRLWNIGKYLGSIVLFCAHAVGMISFPFRHGILYFKSLKDRKFRTAIMIFAGILVSIPFVLILTVLLAEADMVFKDFLHRFMGSFLNPGSVFSVTFMTITGFVGMYCLICGAAKKAVNEELKESRKEEPVIAITVMSIIGVVYLVFCIIQIVYLFMGRGVLPDGLTYSEYARQGFFQLVFVAVVNLVLVLNCLKYFKKSAVLNAVLTVVSICTCVMIASAGYRMILYVQEYQLTLLRILVLWFLAVLSLLMVGVLAVIYSRRFPLFSYCLTVVSVCYLALAWIRPDYLIADYNVRHINEFSSYDIEYLADLSADAAPLLRELQQSGQVENNEYYSKDLEDYFEKVQVDMTWRTYNFSYAKAKNR